MTAIVSASGGWRALLPGADHSSPHLRRAACTATVLGNCIYFIGGWSIRPEGRTHLKDVVVYDLETKQFDLTCPALPGEGRAHHTATAVDHKIWIIGGSGISDVFSDTLVFDTEKRAWRTYAFGGRKELLQRLGHAAVRHPTQPSVILMFGGYGRGTSQEHTFLNDLLALRIEQRQVQQLTPSGGLPEPRAYHSLSCLGQSIFIVGGRRGSNNAHELLKGTQRVIVYNAATNAYFRPELSGSLPSRSSHGAAVVGKSLVVSGGAGYDLDARATARCNDLHVMTADAAATHVTCTLLQPAGPLPGERSAHAMAVLRDDGRSATICMAGGYCGGPDRAQGYRADLWALDLQLASTSGTSSEAARAPRQGASAWRTKRPRVESGSAERQPAAVHVPSGRSVQPARPAALPISAPQPPLAPEPDPANAALTAQIHTLQHSEAGARGRCAQLEGEVARLKESLASVDARWQSIAQECKALQQQQHQLHAENSSLVSRHEALSNTHRDMAQQLASEQAALRRVTDEAAHAGAAHAQELALRKGGFEATVAERDRALTERERQLTAVQVQLNEQHSKAMNAEMRLGQKEQALELARGQLQERELRSVEERKAAEATTGELRQSLAAERHALESSRREAAGHRERGDAAEAQARTNVASLEDCRRTVKDLEARLVREAEDASRLRQSHGTLTVEHTRLKEQYSQLLIHGQHELHQADVHLKALLSRLQGAGRT